LRGSRRRAASLTGENYCRAPSRPKNLRTELAVRFRKAEKPSDLPEE
jgi:hypothetical protein